MAKQYTKDEKERYIELFEELNATISDFSREYNIPKSTLKDWIDDADNETVVFKYDSSMGSDVAISLLKDYKQKLVTDKYASYNALTTSVHTGCWAHARRYFIESISLINNKEDEISVGYAAVTLINKFERRSYRYKTTTIIILLIFVVVFLFLYVSIFTACSLILQFYKLNIFNW